MTDTFELEKQIRKNGFTKSEIAEQLGLTLQGLSLKINNVNEFKASEIAKICSLLNLRDNSIFFKDSVN